MSKPSIICPRCHGKGHLPLGDLQWEVFQLVRQANGLTSEGLRALRLYRRQIHKCESITNSNNLLEDLRRLGLVNRKTKQGRKWLYTPTKL